MTPIDDDPSAARAQLEEDTYEAVEASAEEAVICDEGGAPDEERQSLDAQEEPSAKAEQASGLDASELDENNLDGPELDGLDARGAQEALATAFEDGDEESEDEPSSEEIPTGQSDQEDAPQDGHSDKAEALVAEKPVWTAAQQAEQLRMVEALLFASADALDVKTIAGRLPAGAEIKVLLAALCDQYQNRGVHLVESSGKWRFITAPDVAHVLEKEKVEQRKLSRAALETLAIIAYHQPCTRADIEDVRGVAVSKGSLDQLLEIGWVRLRGRRMDVPGRPVLYATTPAFLEHFNLQTVEDLPGMSDLKAAGLLDARLPPGFSVPTPKSDDGEESDEGEASAGEDAVFAEDYLKEGEEE